MQQLELMLKNKYLQPEAVFSDTLTLARYANNPQLLTLPHRRFEECDADRIIQMPRDDG